MYSLANGTVSSAGSSDCSPAAGVAGAFLAPLTVKASWPSWSVVTSAVTVAASLPSSAGAVTVTSVFRSGEKPAPVNSRPSARKSFSSTSEAPALIWPISGFGSWVGVGEADGVCEGVSDGIWVGVGEADWEGVCDGVAFGVSDGVSVGVGVFSESETTVKVTSVDSTFESLPTSLSLYSPSGTLAPPVVVK